MKFHRVTYQDGTQEFFSIRSNAFTKGRFTQIKKYSVIKIARDKKSIMDLLNETAKSKNNDICSKVPG